MQVHWTKHLKQKWYRNPAKSVKTLWLLVKEIPIYITKLEPKTTTDDSIYVKAIWCWDIDWNDVIWCAKKCTDIQLQNVTTVCQGRFLRTSENWKQKSSERHDPQQINLMQGHWLKRYQMKWNEMHRQSAAKNIIVCQTDSYGHHKTGNKNHQRHDPQKKSIWCSHIEPRTLTRKEIEFTHSKPEHYQWLSKRFFQKPRNWKQK